jgi:hypothetical protein
MRDGRMDVGAARLSDEGRDNITRLERGAVLLTVLEEKQNCMSALGAMNMRKRVQGF